MSSKGRDSSYDELQELVRIHLEQKQARNIKNAYAAPDPPPRHFGNPATPQTSPPKQSSRGVCWQWRKQGACSQGSRCPSASDHDPLNAPQRRGGRSKSPGKGKRKGKREGGRYRSDFHLTTILCARTHEPTTRNETNS